MAISAETLITVEKSIQNLLEKRWRVIGRRIAKKILAGIRKDNHEEVEKAVQLIALEQCMGKDLTTLKLLSSQAFYFGVSRLSTPGDSVAKTNKLSVGWVEKSLNQMELILKYANTKLRRRVRDLVNAEYIRQATLTKGEVLHAFVSAIEKTLETGGGNPALAASLHTSRLAQMGFLIEATAMGKVTYMINAMLDARTCQICAGMDKKVFKVETLWNRMSKAIEATDVDTLKRLAPWPPQTIDGIDAVKNMTSQEIINSGYDSPPYHPYCRCFLDYDETPVQVVESQITQIEIPEIPGTILRNASNPLVAVFDPGVLSELGDEFERALARALDDDDLLTKLR